MKLSKVCHEMLLYCILIYANYYAILDRILPINSIYLVTVISFGLIFVLVGLQGFKVKINRNCATILAVWLLFMVFVIIRNRDFSSGNYRSSLILISAIILIYTSILDGTCQIEVPHMIIKVGIWNVFATYFFYIFSGMYKYIYNFLGKSVIGVGGGIYGYRAGLADHYSQNAIYITIVTLVLFALLMTNKENKQKACLTFMFILSILALAMTTKRAHFIFCIISMVALYYALNPQKFGTKTFKICVFACFMVLVAYVLVSYSPALYALYERYTNITSDGSAYERTQMLNLAWKYFKDNFLLGIGWNGFKYKYAILAGSSKNAHNTYVQLLCETGVVGFFVYLVAAVSTFTITVKQILSIKKNGIEYKKGVCVATSFAIQVFVLLYQMTGNCLYDVTAYFYFAAILIIIPIEGKNTATIKNRMTMI